LKKISFLFAAVIVMAATSAYKLRDINLTVTLPPELVVFTRETTASDPNYDYLEKEALEFTADMEQKNIYLYAINKDKTYDITITATPYKQTDNEFIDDYVNLSNEKLEEVRKKEASKLEASEGITVIDSYIYNDNKIPFIVYKILNNTDNNTVYILEAYTLKEETNYFIRLQSYDKEITQEMADSFNEILKSSDFSKLKGSSTQYRILKEMIELLIGFAIVAAILMIIILILRARNNNKHHHIF